MNKRMTIMLIIGFLAGASLVAYGLYAKYGYTHPPDYTEGSVTVVSSTPPAAATSAVTSSLPAKTESTPKTPAAGPEVKIDGVTFHVDIADTIPKQVQGLSGRDPLRADEGMLFIFPFAHSEGFWMYNMKFALDIIWIKGTTIIGIAENLPPPTPGEASSSLPVYSSPGSVDKVLEVNAGTAAKYGFKTGDTIKVTLK